jgi:integrase
VQDPHDRPPARRKLPEGTEVRHGRACASHAGGKCSCEPGYRLWVYDPKTGKRVPVKTRGGKQTFRGKGAIAEMKSARRDALVAIDKGTMLATPNRQTVGEAWTLWLQGARSGTVRNAAEEAYKPSVVRTYEIGMRLHVLPRLGSAKLVDIRRRDLQRIVDEMLAAGYSASAARNALLPIRCLFRRAIEDETLTINPASNLRIPKSKGRRDHKLVDGKMVPIAVSASQAMQLIEALPTIMLRALWACAVFAGLRRGELRALRCENVDLAAGIIHVEHGWDDVAGAQDPKSEAGRRGVPIAGRLRDYLDTLKLETGRGGTDLFFGDTARDPFSPSKVQRIADRAWKEAGLPRVTLHELRHSYASLLIDSGENLKALSTYCGHSSIQVTLDLYGHLLPGNEKESTARFDSYLTRSDSASRIRQLEGSHDG